MPGLSGVRLAFVVAVAIVAVAAVGAVAVTATPYDPAAVTSAALDALGHQYDGVLVTTPLTAANPQFTGAAATAMAPMLAQQRRNYAAGEDYPGPASSRTSRSSRSRARRLRSRSICGPMRSCRTCAMAQS